MPSSSSRKPAATVPAVRDLTPPNAGGAAPLRLTRAVSAVAPAPRIAGRTTPAPLLQLDGTGGRKDGVVPIARMLLSRVRRLQVRRIVPSAPAPRPSSSPLLLDFSGRVDVRPRRVRRAAPLLLALSVTTALLLITIAGIRLAQVGSVALGEAGMALESSREGMRALARATPAEASALFEDARSHLSRTGELLGRVAVGSGLAGLSPAEHGTRVVQAAEDASSAGTDLAAAMGALDGKDLPTAFARAETGLAHLANADDGLAGTGALLPANVRSEAERTGRELHAARLRLEPLRLALPALKAAAGADGPRRYLLLFQNDAERRGTGGFLGSFAVLEFDALRVTRFEFKDVYAVDWKQDGAPLPPSGLRRYYETMHLRDANYSPDFPTAAKWVEWYYERSGGSTVDGILAVDSQVFLNLLETLGPVTLPGSETVLTRTNAIDLLTARIETSKKDPAGPKDVLADLMPVLAERLHDRSRWAALAQVVDTAASEKHLFAFAKDPAMQAIFRAQGIDGSVAAPRANADELAFVSTNVGGNKSDRFTTLAATHHATVRADGSVDVALELRKTFRLPEDFDARIAPLLAGRDEKTRAYLRHVLGDGTNKDYLRVFLPLGTTVRAVEGMSDKDWEVHEELGRTVVGLHLATQVGEIRTVKLRYELPLRLDFLAAATYRFRAWKQPGTLSQELRHELTVEPGLSILGADTRSIATDLSGPTDASTASVITRS